MDSLATPTEYCKVEVFVLDSRKTAIAIIRTNTNAAHIKFHIYHPLKNRHLDFVLWTCTSVYPNNYNILYKHIANTMDSTARL